MTNRFCNRYVNNDTSKGLWRVLGGPVGCGKTMLARCVFRTAISQTMAATVKANRKMAMSPEVAYVKWVNHGSDEVNEKDFAEYLLHRIKPATLVIIDDIGVETDRYKSGVGRMRLMRVLEVSERKWLFATTNLRPDQYLTKYDDRVASRLKGAVSLWVDAPDYREIKKGLK